MMPAILRDNSLLSVSRPSKGLEHSDAYSTPQFANTYFLAYRDLLAIIAEHVTGKRALDFGCGTGRSTRFLEPSSHMTNATRRGVCSAVKWYIRTVRGMIGRLSRSSSAAEG
jgi:hypothetical protein